MVTFTYAPDYGATARRKPRVKTVQFGDGYEFRQAEAVNNLAEIWDLPFTNLSEEDGNAIDDFLIARNGESNFDWTPPGGTEGKYICREWTKTYSKGNRININATFEQVFEA